MRIPGLANRCLPANTVQELITDLHDCWVDAFSTKHIPTVKHEIKKKTMY